MELLDSIATEAADIKHKVGDFFAGVPNGEGTPDATPDATQTPGGGTDPGVEPGDPAHEWDDNPPAGADQAQPQALAQPRPESGNGAGPSYAAAVQQLKEQNDNLCGQAALLLGMSAQNSDPPFSDAELAARYHTTPPVVAARRQEFQQRYVADTASRLLSGAPVLQQTIVQKPQVAPLVQKDIGPLATMESVLAGAFGYLHEVAGRHQPGDDSFIERAKSYGLTGLDLLGSANQAGLDAAGAGLDAAGRTSLEFFKGMGGATNDLAKFAALISSVRGIVDDKVLSLATGKDVTYFEDPYFKVANWLENNSENYAVDPENGIPGKAAHAIGGLVAQLPYMYATGGAAEAAPLLEGGAGVVARLFARGSSGAKAMALPAASAGVNTANDVYAQGGNGWDAAKAGAMRYATTTATGMVPLAIPGKLATRALSGFPIGVATGEAARQLDNLALPENLQQKFDWGDLFVSGLLGSAMGGLGPHSPHADALQAMRDYRRLNIVGDISRNAALRQGDPEAFKQMVRDMAQGGDLHTLYVDGSALVHTLREAGITMDELRATMPGVAKQVGEAAELKGYVAIPVEEYAAQAGSKVDPAIRRLFKKDPDPKAMTYGEAQKFQSDQADRMKEEAASLVRDKEQADQFRKSQDVVEGKILDDLHNAGRLAHEDNTLIAKVQTATLSHLAALEKITPEQAYEKYGANLRGEAHDGPQDAFEQQNEEIAKDPNFVREAIRVLSERDPDVFKMPIVRKDSLADTLREHFDYKGSEIDPTTGRPYNDGSEWKNNGNLGVFPVALHPDGTEVHAFRTPEGENFWVHEHPDRTMHINVSQLRGNGNGQFVYQAVHDFAVHNNKVFKADSAGLSDESLIRRTANMLNAVIRHNTAAHILPGIEQFSGNEKLGVPPLKWGRSEVDKFNALAQTFVETIENNVPQIKDIRYDAAKKGFLFSDTGSVVEDKDWRILAESREAQRVRAGEGSLRRAVFLKSLIHSESKGQREREKVLAELRLFVGSSAEESGLDHLFQSNDKSAPEQTDSSAIDGGAKDEPRGSYDPATRTVALLKNADVSTPLHETAHWALDIYSKIAAHPEANPELRADMGAILKWFGVQDLETWNAMSIVQQRPYHEQFAKGFETYLMEGKAPTPELQPVFARIKELMLEIYKSIEALGVKLTPEIRGVMDRMLGGARRRSGKRRASPGSERLNQSG